MPVPEECARAALFRQCSCDLVKYPLVRARCMNFYDLNRPYWPSNSKTGESNALFCEEEQEQTISNFRQKPFGSH